MDNVSLRHLLRRWFSDGEETALAECLGALQAAMAVPPSVAVALGSGEIEDAREDVLIRMLDRESGALRGVESPLAFARASLRRALVDRLRAQVRRARVRIDSAIEPQTVEVASPLDVATMAERARRVAEAMLVLTPEQRLSIVLTTFAERVPPGDRPALRGLPLTAPLPQGSLTVEAASALLFGVPAAELDSQRYQRIDRFHKLHTRALAALRRQLIEAADS